MSTSFFDDEEDEEAQDSDDSDDVVDVDGEVVESETESLPTPEDTGGVVKPVEDLDEVAEAYEAFEEVKNKLLTPKQDTVKIGNNWHIKKSGWRKIATAFNVSVETTTVESEVDDGVVRYIVTARAVAPNNKTASGTGMCTSSESNFMRRLCDQDAGREEAHTRADNPDNVLLVDGYYRELKSPREVNQHNIMATAETRAKNRAISDLVGGGEVSAEEMSKKAGEKKREEILEE